MRAWQRMLSGRRLDLLDPSPLDIEIADIAHTRGALEGKRPDYFQRAGILIDIIDARTNKLVYRNFATGDVVRGASEGTRAARIDAAVGQALEAFFVKN